MSIRTITWVAKGRGFVVNVDGKRAGEIVRKSGRRAVRCFLGADLDESLVLEVYKGVPVSERYASAVDGVTYGLNRQALSLTA